MVIFVSRLQLHISRIKTLNLQFSTLQHLVFQCMFLWTKVFLSFFFKCVGFFLSISDQPLCICSANGWHLKMLVLEHGYPLHGLLLAFVATVILHCTFQHVSLMIFNDIALLSHLTLLSNRIKAAKKSSFIRVAFCNESTKMWRDQFKAKKKKR